MYFVGSIGLIKHYNGQNWQSIDSDTELDLLDIYGNDANTIYSCGVNYGPGLGIVLKYNGTKFEKMIEGFYYGSGFDSTKLFISQLYGPLDGLWVDEFNTLYVVGHFVYRYKNGKWGYIDGIEDNKLSDQLIYSRGYLHGIRGSAINNIVIAGERGTLLHFNGMTWKQIGPPFDFNSEYDWYRVAVTSNCVIAAGKKGISAAVIKLQY